jgi:hypothetical protein
MVVMLLLLLSILQPAQAQEISGSNSSAKSDRGTLELPAVTLLGEYVVYLPVPRPKSPGLPAVTGMRTGRLSTSRPAPPPPITAPEPSELRWPSVHASIVRRSGVPSRADEGLQSADDLRVQTASAPPAWQARVDYLPRALVQSSLLGSRYSGSWERFTDLALGLADGWLESEPGSPTYLSCALTALRRTEALLLKLEGGAGVFYPPSTSPRFTLMLGAELGNQGPRIHWREKTRLYGNNDSNVEGQIGLAEQEIDFAVFSGQLGAAMKASGVVRDRLPSADNEMNGLAGMELAFLPSSLPLRLRAGAAAVYYDSGLDIYPTAHLELYPTNWLAVTAGAAPFIRPPSKPDLYAVQADSDLPQLAVEGGYAVTSRLALDMSARLQASVSFEWINGRIYRFRDQAFFFEQANQGTLSGQLAWNILETVPGRPGMRIYTTGKAGFPFPPPAAVWQALLFYSVGAQWVLDFHKPSTEIIIEALWGEFADDGSSPFLFENWSIFSGLMTGIEANVDISNRHSLRAGVEIFIPIEKSGQESYTLQFLLGYGIRG